MGELQACTAALDARCTPPVVPLPHHISSHTSRSGGASSTEGKTSSYDATASPLPTLERASDGETSISPTEISEPTGNGPPFVQDYYHGRPAHEATTNFTSVCSQQQVVVVEENGHAIASPRMDTHFEGDPHLLADGNNHNSASLLYPQMPGLGSYLDVNLVEVLAELERERKKNVELQSRVISLEAQLGSDDKQVASAQNGQKKAKKQRKAGKAPDEGEEEESRKALHHQTQLPAIKHEDGVILHVALPLEVAKQTDRQDCGVTWMSRDEVTPADVENLSNDILSGRDDSGDSSYSDSDDDDEEFEDEEDGEGIEDGREKKKRKSKEEVWRGRIVGEEARRGGLSDGTEEGEKRLPMGASGERFREEDDWRSEGKKNWRRMRKGKGGKKGKRGDNTKRSLGHELASLRGSGVMSAYRKAPKTAFCPMEVKRIMESGVLALKNAQSHTIRKIVVFASLGIRHGCEDLYELDISHFSVVRRGEPYKSSKDLGEHVLYNYPGVRTKIFYPNRQNPVLCPVRILDEEKAMRPVGLTCPSCLFLCIKYGGRTRNLPQNEYVRQRMGRNKLKSFGPLMCQMALLVHIRTGSFFFKALGITLLFMAGFPDDLVRKETKYRNLDLLQKYYRSDEDARGEQLFHPYPPFFPQVMMVAPPVAHNKPAITAKVGGKKGPPPLLSKPASTPPLPRYLQTMSQRPPTTTPFQGLPPAFSPPIPSIPPVPPSAGAAVGSPSPPGPSPPPYGMYPPYHSIQQPPGFAHMPWPPVNSYPPGHYPPPPYAYPPFSHHQFVPPFYGPPYRFSPYGQQSSPRELKKEPEESQASYSDSDSGKTGACLKGDEKGSTMDSKETQ